MIGAPATAGADRVPRTSRALAAGAGAILTGAMALAGVIAGINGVALEGLDGTWEGGRSENPSAVAQRDLPPRYLRLYEQAGRAYGLDWGLLAGIGKVECDHGRTPDPSCWREGAQNAAGAGGPMQFLAPTWARFGVDADGDGRADRWEPADAIYGAANYLRASGAPREPERALYAYNHAGWYVAKVQRWASLYRGSSAQPLASPLGSGLGLDGADASLPVHSPTPVLFTAGRYARLAPADSHLALVPAQAPAQVQAMVVAGNELQQLNYGPAGHPDPRGSTEEDCSSTVNYVLYRSGIRPIAEIARDNPLAQDYIRWGLPGPGRWASIYATASPTPHVFVVIAGLRLDTSHAGTDVGPNRNEDGPRWRVLDHVPAWAHWSVRHPPGL